MDKPRSAGDDAALYVVCDPVNWQVLEAALRTTFEKTVITPQSEKLFEVFWVAPDQFNTYATRGNLVILGILNQEGEINAQVGNMLAEQVKQKVIEGSAFYFTKESPWAKGQLLVVLADTSPELLAAKLASNKSLLYNIFYDRLVESQKIEMFALNEQTELSEKFLQQFGWSLRVQHDYQIQYQRPDNRFVMLRRSMPGIERWLFVHWIEDADPGWIDKAWVSKTRDKLTAKFYENDRVEPDYLEAGNVMFAGHPAYLVKGLWTNDQKVAGGPFRNYAFYDANSDRIYMVDIAVYHPSGKLRLSWAASRTIRRWMPANCIWSISTSMPTSLSSPHTGHQKRPRNLQKMPRTTATK
jgi:hypothetical protein